MIPGVSADNRDHLGSTGHETPEGPGSSGSSQVKRLSSFVFLNRMRPWRAVRFKTGGVLIVHILRLPEPLFLSKDRRVVSVSLSLALQLSLSHAHTHKHHTCTHTHTNTHIFSLPLSNDNKIGFVQWKPSSMTFLVKEVLILRLLQHGNETLTSKVTLGKLPRNGVEHIIYGLF